MLTNTSEVVGAKTKSAMTTEKKHLTIFGTEFVYLYLLGIATAFCGWMAENIARLVSKGIIDSRFHLLPFISTYALIPFAFKILLGDSNNITFFGKRVFKKQTRNTKILSNVISFVSICLAVFLGELVWGNFCEAAFGVKLWDYSKQLFHITQYTGALSTFGFGAAAYLLFKFVHAPLLKFAKEKVPYKVALWICLTLGVLIVLDTLFMQIQMVAFGEAPVYWSINLR